MTAREHTAEVDGKRTTLTVGQEFDGTESQLLSNPDRLEKVEELVTQPKRTRRKRKTNEQSDASASEGDTGD